MLLLHDPTVGHSIRSRIQALSPTAHHRWGKMSVDQMLWHCNQVLSTSLGDMQVVQRLPPFPVPVLKLMLFHLPWPHGAPTAPEYKAEGPRAFEAERTQCLELIDRFTARKLEEGTWARVATLDAGDQALRSIMTQLVQVIGDHLSEPVLDRKKPELVRSEPSGTWNESTGTTRPRTIVFTTAKNVNG